jgi:hypothetical protein
MALAKLGAPEQQFEIVCEAREGDNVSRTDALMEKLPYVGGAFAIKEYKGLLVLTRENTGAAGTRRRTIGDKVLGEYMRREARRLGGPLPIDEQVMPPAGWIAVKNLREILEPKVPMEQLPKKDKKMSLEEAASLWRDWLEQNQEKVRQMQPLGDQMKYSPAKCRKYLKRQMGL